MRSMIVAAAVVVMSAAAAHAAEVWSCSYRSVPDNRPVISRFEVSPPDLVELKFHQTYHIEQNNNYGIVATSAISEIEQGYTQPTVGVVSIVINKRTGEFWWVTAITGMPAAVNQPAHGRCIKE